MSAVAPIVLGYQTVRLDTTERETVVGRRILHEFAAKEGYALGEIFVEDDLNHPGNAMAAMIAACRYGEVDAVVVPSWVDLGRMVRVQQGTKQRIEHQAGVRVLVATPRE
jgi:hypothetical protein